MTTEKIYEEASRPATLHNGAVSTDYPTLQEPWWRGIGSDQSRRKRRPSASLAVRSTPLPKSRGFTMGRSQRDKLRSRNHGRVLQRPIGEPIAAALADQAGAEMVLLKRDGGSKIRRTTAFLSKAQCTHSPCLHGN